MYTVHDFCGLLQDLESLDEQKIIREAVGNAFQVREEGSIIRSVKDFLGNGFYRLLFENGFYRIFDDGTHGLPPFGLLCVLAARLLWCSSKTKSRAIYYGPVALLSHDSFPAPDSPILGFWSVRYSGKVHPCRPPEPFSQDRWIGRIFKFELACFVGRLEGTPKSTDVYGFASVYFLLSPNEQDLAAIKSAWVEACMSEASKM